MFYTSFCEIHVFHRQLSHRVSGSRYQAKKKSAPGPLRPGLDTKQNKKTAPGSLRPGSDTKKKKITPGPKRYQETKVEVSQLKLKQARNKLHT